MGQVSWRGPTGAKELLSLALLLAGAGGRVDLVGGGGSSELPWWARSRRGPCGAEDPGGRAQGGAGTFSAAEDLDDLDDDDDDGGDDLDNDRDNDLVVVVAVVVVVIVVSCIGLR